ncbi:hypothetical protein [Streptomyces sp. NPDC049944]|uniref:hypothetical protein n=1 Tax=Streptomyces sp. NPDC049944 TaxID=3155657 RepID=UPI0034458D47
MPTPPRNRRASRAGVAAAGLIAMASAPAAFGDEAAPELAVGGIEPISGVQPGNSFALPVTVANKGIGAADKVWVSYVVNRGLDFTEIPSNCLSQQVWSYDEMPERWLAVCAFDQAVEPGVVYTPEKPLRIKARDRALNDRLRVQVGDVDPGADENGTAPNFCSSRTTPTACPTSGRPRTGRGASLFRSGTSGRGGGRLRRGRLRISDRSSRSRSTAKMR